MTRGRCWSLALHRTTLSFATPRLFTPAHRESQMKTRVPFPIAVLAAALLGLMAVGVPGAAAATLVVDDDGMASAADCNALTPAFTTISAAVAAASPGDTIKVCP